VRNLRQRPEEEFLCKARQWLLPALGSHWRAALRRAGPGRDVLYALRKAKDIDAITATQADAYRFLDEFRHLFQIPFEANLSIVAEEARA
jgi:hypothetical protein